jgi:predicted S18 family serine protease
MLAPSSDRLSFIEPLSQQIRRLDELRTSAPEKSKQIFASGESLINFAANGELRKLQNAILSYEKGEIFSYFVVKVCLSDFQ